MPLVRLSSRIAGVPMPTSPVFGELAGADMFEQPPTLADVLERQTNRGLPHLLLVGP